MVYSRDVCDAMMMVGMLLEMRMSDGSYSMIALLCLFYKVSY